MGRINDALRRAHAEPTSSLIAQNQKAFTAPWDVGETEQTAPSLEAATPVPTAVPPPTVPAPLTSLLDDSRPTVFGGFNPEWLHRLVIHPNANTVLVEQFRSLAASLHRLQVNGMPKVLMVTSTDPGEGKTLSSLNLALTLSESYQQRVLLIDADLRRPSIREVSQLGNTPGLSEGLKAPADKKLSVIPLTKTLTLLPAGTPDPNPMSSLTSPRMRRIIDEAAQRFDWVVLDAPPIGPVADASLLASMVDGAVFVVRAGRTSFAAVERAVESLGRDRILGVILNGVDAGESAPYGRYYGDPAEPAPTARLRE